MKYEIHTGADLGAMSVCPTRENDWFAHFGDYDEGVQCGRGATEEAAIADLVTNYDLVPA
ncbi:MAG: hypothetical protein ACREPX_03935 [Rhodanobacteraceae bacterium]